MQNNAEEIMALGQARLIEILGKPDAPVFDKAKACQQLAVVGTRDAVPALAALLSDAKVAHYARFGLEPIPDPVVDDALREAAGKLNGRLLVGVINSIGHRRDAKAVDLLSKFMNDPDAEVAESAAASLGAIGTPQAAAALQSALANRSAPVFPAAAVAGLTCAEGLTAKGRRKEALAMYQKLSGADMPKPVRTGAARAARRMRASSAPPAKPPQ